MTPWTVVYQAPPSMGFSRQEHWSGLPFPSAGDLPDPGIEPGRCLRSAGKENKTRPPNYKWGSRAWKDTCDGVRTTGRGGDRFSLTPVGKGGIRGLGVVLLASICRWGNWGQARQPLATIARLGWWEEGSNNPGRVPGGDQGSLRTWEARGGKTWGGGGQWGDSLLEGKWTAPLRLKGRDGRRTCTRERTGCTGRELHAGATCSGQGTTFHAFKMLAESMNEMWLPFYRWRAWDSERPGDVPTGTPSCPSW